MLLASGCVYSLILGIQIWAFSNDRGSWLFHLLMTAIVLFVSEYQRQFNAQDAPYETYAYVVIWRKIRRVIRK